MKGRFMFNKPLLVVMLFLINSEFLFARGPVTEDTDPENLDFYLLTVGLGDGIAARYGHTIIRMVDTNSRRESNINWGMFNFADPYLPLNFFLGQLRYWVTDEPSKHLYQRYQYFEKRPVISEKINLTNEQKRELFELIMENLKPKNRYFWYQYFYKNCATIPRDYLNQVLDGALKERFVNQVSATKFREYVRINLNRPPIIAFFLDIVMNSRLDEPLPKWIEMFYPAKLREYLLTLPAYDDMGKPLEGTQLLSETTTIVDLEDVPEDPWTLHPWFLGLNLLGFIVGFGALLSKRIEMLSLHKLGNIILGTLLGLWSTFSGVLGMIMASSWAFSSHLDLHHNANLFLMWPVDLFFILVSCSIIFGKKSSSPFSLLRIGFCLAWAHLLLIPVWVLAYMTGLVSQDCSLVVTYLAPVAILNYLCVIYYYKKSLQQT